MIKFEIEAINNYSRAGILQTPDGSIQTPVFMPVGTLGAVKTMAPNDLEEIRSQVILGNSYHLYLRPGFDIINEAVL